MTRHQWVKFFLWGLVGAAVLVLLYLSTRIDPELIASFTRSLGPLGWIFMSLLATVTQIVAPVAGGPVVYVAIKLYGLFRAQALLYGAGLISAAVNFYLARRFGRPLVKKIAGAKALAQVDKMTLWAEEKYLILARIFGFAIAELVSYAFGLTTISFVRYFAITAVFQLVPVTVSYFIFRFVDFASFWGVLLWVGSIVVSSMIFSQLIYQVYGKNKTSESEEKRG